MARLATRSFVGALAAVLIACSSSPVPSTDPAASTSSDPQNQSPSAPVGPAAAGRIDVQPSAVLLTGSGQAAHLTATASAADGSAIPVTWRSSDQAQVTVDQEGNVTAVAELGSALIFAEAGDQSTPVSVLIAHPAPGALLVSDQQVVAAPRPLGDPNALPSNGDHYEVTLSGIDAPAVGTILLATGSAAIGGKVTAAAPGAAGVRVEYELVPLPQMLTRYSFDLDIPLDPGDAGLEPVASSANQFASLNGPPEAPVQELADEVKAEKEKKFTRGPLECKASVAAKFKSTDFDITATTGLSLVLEGRKEVENTSTPEHTKVAVTGPLALQVSGGLRAEAGFEGSASCELKKHIPIPLGGVLAVVLAITVPIGLAASAEGKVKAVDVAIGPTGHLGTNVTVGFECDSNACWAITEQTPDADNGVTLESKVNLLPDMRVEAGIGLNVITGLGFKVGTDEYSLIDAKIGPVQSLNLAFKDSQARDTSYASAYDLKFAGSVTPGEDLKTAISRIFGGAVTLDLSAKYNSEPISESPKGTLSVEKPQVQVGKPVKLSIDLQPKTIDYWPIGANVVELQLAQWKDDKLTPIESIPIGASGQTRFDYVWTPSRDFLGMNELVAFVITKGLPSMPLEVAPRSSAFVEVVDACLADPATPAPGVPTGASPPPLDPTKPAPPPPPPDPCGRGTVTISREKHGTYTSNRNNPVQLDSVDVATITFDLVADEFAPGDFVADDAAISWSYGMRSVESADGCAVVESIDGGGSWTGTGPADGPSVLNGWSAPDGTIFGMLIDDSSYVLQVLPPANPDSEFNARSWYQGKSDICGEIVFGLQMPYVTLAVVDGKIPDGGVGTYSGTRQRTIPPVSDLDLPTTETVTWSFSIDPN